MRHEAGSVSAVQSASWHIGKKISRSSYTANIPPRRTRSILDWRRYSVGKSSFVQNLSAPSIYRKNADLFAPRSDGGPPWTNY